MLKKTFLIAAVLWTSIVLVLCLIQLDGAPKIDVENFDKYVHSIFHFVLTSLWLFFFKLEFKNDNKYKPFVISFLLSVLLGVMIEVLQKCCTQNRTGDLFDVFANMSGAIVSISLFYILDSFKVLKSIS